MPTTTTSIQLSDFLARRNDEAIYAVATADLHDEFADVRNRILGLGIETMEAVCELFAILDPAGLDVNAKTIDLAALESEERSFEIITERVLAEVVEARTLEFAAA